MCSGVTDVPLRGHLLEALPGKLDRTFELEPTAVNLSAGSFRSLLSVVGRPSHAIASVAAVANRRLSEGPAVGHKQERFKPGDGREYAARIGVSARAKPKRPDT